MFLQHALADEASWVVDAAKRADPSVSWQAKTVLNGNFTCQGKIEFAILGTSTKEIVIAVISTEKGKPIDVIRFSGVARSTKSAILAIEPLDFTIDEFKREVGELPDGLRPSKTCVGLNMSDEMIDSAHIFWHRKAKRFESWSR